MKVYPTANVTGHIHHPDGDAGDIGDGCQIHVDVLCGDGVHIAPNVTIVGKHPVKLRDGVTLSPGVVIYTSRPDVDRPGRNGYRDGHEPIRGPVTLGEDVFVGSAAVIGCGVTVADGVAIGAGAFVDEDIDEPRTLWIGRPATRVRELDAGEEEIRV